ncbi:MAG: agmatinase [Candidatus Omnitrophica bacterium]|nr:agmatinase [Candidatus Omnitrophota bacterium]
MKQFLGLSAKEACTYSDASVIIVPVPFECTVSFGEGTAHAPRAIIDASSQVELYSIDLGRNIYERGIHTLAPLCKATAASTKQTRSLLFERIEKTASRIIKDGKKGVFLGGEHTIALPIIRAYQRSFGTVTVLHFDAHSDLRNSYQRDKLSHASTMRRIHELGVEHVSVGIRSQCIEEASFIRENNLKVFYMEAIRKGASSWMQDVIRNLGDTVYVTFDVDCLDPAIVPATGTPEPGGFDWYQIQDFLAALRDSGIRVAGFDFVEFAPQETHHASAFLCAKLIYNMIGYLFT